MCRIEGHCTETNATYIHVHAICIHIVSYNYTNLQPGRVSDTQNFDELQQVLEQCCDDINFDDYTVV